MSANDNFGKDLGLIGEVVVTGRKAGMSKAAWAFLAHHEVEFSTLAVIVEHWAVITKNNAEVNVVSPEKAEELIQLVTTITKATASDCLHCVDVGRRLVHHLYVPGEILTIDADKRRQCVVEEDALEIMYRRQEVEYQKYLYKFIADRLLEMGIHPAELIKYVDEFNFDEEGCLTLSWCCNAEMFSEAIRRIVRQRNVLAFILTLS